jgi:hypothetical protein
MLDAVLPTFDKTETARALATIGDHPLLGQIITS